MPPPKPKRPPRPRAAPEDKTREGDEGELPFDEREATPLRADDPRPQRVAQYPVRDAGGARALRDVPFGAGRPGAGFAEPGTREVFLYAERGPGAGQLLPVTQGTLVVGRSSSSDLRLAHASISRRHAQILRRGERFFLKDLASQNGTFLDDERVSPESEMQIGQRILIGPSVLKLRLPGGPHGSAGSVDEDEGAWSEDWHPEHRAARRRMRRVALTAGIVGFGLAALLTVAVLRIYPGALRPIAPAPSHPALVPPPARAP